jgi:hypothetical protein
MGALQASLERVRERDGSAAVDGDGAGKQGAAKRPAVKKAATKKAPAKPAAKTKTG